MSMTDDREGQIDSTRLIFPGLAGLYQSVAPYSYAIIRFCAGALRVSRYDATILPVSGVIRK